MAIAILKYPAYLNEFLAFLAMLASLVWGTKGTGKSIRRKVVSPERKPIRLMAHYTLQDGYQGLVQ